jgi:hypothetical protein
VAVAALVTVSPTATADVLDAGDEVADLADAEAAPLTGSGEITPTSSIS